MDTLDFNKKLLASKKKTEKSKRKCMFPGCSNRAAKNHVFQEHGILNIISENDHLFQKKLEPFSKSNNILNEQRIGINDAYTFYGFCSQHDDSLFSIIEKKADINYKEGIEQALFCYRGLCQEIRRKEMFIEILKNMSIKPLELLISANLTGIENLNFFKAKLEECIRTKNFDNFVFETIEIPKIDVCISSPLNIEEKNNDLTNSKNRIFTTSFVNLFPQKDKSLVILGYHKEFPCNWIRGFFSKIKLGVKEEIFKEISDLISLRVEFWVMSPKLFRSIPVQTIEKYKSYFNNNIFNHNIKESCPINLFEHL